MKQIQFFFTIILLGIICIESKAATCTAIGGNWNSSATWSCGRMPQDGDVLEIPENITVIVNINTPRYSGVVINVSGTLSFNNGQKINLENDGVVNVNGSGKLTGGTPGSKINIGNNDVWSGPDETPGPFTLTASGSGPLPIVLSSFTAELKNDYVKLKWTTSSEKNNDYFTLERSKNGITFSPLTKIKGSGTSNNMKEYGFEDKSPFQGTAYYRLKQTDFDGKTEYSDELSVNYQRNGNGCVLKVNPNPCFGMCTVNLAECDQIENPEILVEILDIRGNIVQSKIPDRSESGTFSFAINTENNLSPGVYIIRGISKNEKYSQKVIVK